MTMNQRGVVLYTGVTNSLVPQVWQHRSGEIDGFTKAHNVNRLVYYECFDDPRDAIAREKVGGFITGAVSALQTFPVRFGSYSQTTMIANHLSILGVLRGPSLCSG